MTVIVERSASYLLADQAFLLEEDRELAWAEKHVIRNPAYKWVLGKFVQTNQANQNGHVFDLEEMKTAKDSVLYAPMNMLHRPKQIVGTFVANEMIYPTTTDAGGVQSAAEVAGMAVETTPYLEALAAFWRYYFQDEYDMVERAHSTGSLFFSMECVPEQLRCELDGCGREFDYKGRQDPSYCDHLNQPRSRKLMIHPHFTAGALIIPPVRPGWRNADVKELSSLLEATDEEREALYDQISTAAPHLDAKACEGLMHRLLAADLKDIHDQNKKKPHGYVALQGDGGKSANAACKKCGLGKNAPVHQGEKSALMVGVEAGLRARESARDVSTSERKAASKKGNTAYGTSFPVDNLSDLNNAIQAWGRAPAGKRRQLKSFLARQAIRLGASDDVKKRIAALSA
jgi:hypothetical protein